MAHCLPPLAHRPCGIGGEDLDEIYLIPRKTLLPIGWIAAHIIATLFIALSSSNIYVGTVYHPQFERLEYSFISGFIITIPFVMIFMAIPFHYLAMELINKAIYNPIFSKYSIWTLCGAVIGIPMMAVYSFILGLGFELWINMSLTGALYGALATLIMRLLVKKDAQSEIDNAT